MSVPPDIAIARGFWARFKGLMLSRPLAAGKGLLITNCTSVHTCFMRYALDLVYLDRSGSVVKLVRHLRPWRVNWGVSSAAHILEMAAGGIDRHTIQMGDSMAWCLNEGERRVT